MGQNLTGKTIASTYEDLVQISGSLRNFLTDGTGSSITSLEVTASNAISSSYALTASFASNVPATASFAISASHADFADSSLSSSYALSASFATNATNAVSSSYAVTASYSETTAPITTIFETVQAGENLVKTDPVYLSGSSGANPIAFKADAAVSAKMPAIYIMNENLSTGQVGQAIALGLIEGVNLSGYDAGMEVYVAAGGGWTNVRPTGTSIVQALGVITKGGAGGKGFVYNAGEFNLPNIAQGFAWVGNSSSYPVAVATSSFTVDNAVSASYALSASHADSSNTTVSASYALSASHADSSNTSVSASHAVNADSSNTSVSASHAVNADSAISSSYALSSSFATTASFAINATPAFPFTGSATISGSLTVDGPISTISGSFSGSVIDNLTTPTASDAINHVVAISSTDYNALVSPDPNTFYVINDATGSLILGDTTVSGSLTVTGTLNAPGLTVPTASYAISASLAETASFALTAASANNGFPYTGSAIISGSLTVTGSFIQGASGNTVSDPNSGMLAVGSGNSITATQAAIIGGVSNNTNNAGGGAMVATDGSTMNGGYGLMAGCLFSTQTGTGTVTLGGESHSNTSDDSAIVAGKTHTMSGGVQDSAIIAGKNSVIAAHTGSVILGGNGLATTKNDEVVVPRLTISGSFVDTMVIANYASIDFVDDTAAAAGGIPLGGVYRNGNFLMIRIV